MITQAAGDCPERVAQLVFVAAFMPANGQSLLDLTHLPEGAGDQIQANIVIEGDPPVATLPRRGRRGRDLQPLHARAGGRGRPAAAARRRSRRSPRRSASTTSVLASIPRSYVLTRRTTRFRTALQRRMIAEHPCERVVELDTDHAPFYSATDELVAALLDSAA